MTQASLKKLLVVDDQADIRKLIRLTIGASYEVIEAEDGQSGLQKMRQHQPQVVLLDIMMPGELDGMQVLDIIRRDAALAKTSVIMLTARGQASDFQAGMARGADGYLIKPFSPLQLLLTIKELMK